MYRSTENKIKRCIFYSGNKIYFYDTLTYYKNY